MVRVGGNISGNLGRWAIVSVSKAERMAPRTVLVKVKEDQDLKQAAVVFGVGFSVHKSEADESVGDEVRL